MSLDLSRLENVKPRRDGGWNARCPQCAAAGKDTDGDNLRLYDDGAYRCICDCDSKAIFALAGEVPSARNGHTPSRASKSSASMPIREVAAYDYQDAGGNVVYQVVRYEPKTFKQCRIVNGKRVWKMEGATLVPYRLPLVIGADTVFVTEGEKDVESLEKLGYVATCNPGGVKKWREGWSPYFAGKNIIIFPDNDDPGREHAELVESMLRALAKSIRRVAIPSPAKDISDHLEGMSDTEASAAVDALLSEAEGDFFRCIDWLEFSAQQAIALEPLELVHGLLHQGSKLVLGGSSKSNKTWSLLDMAISVASGKPWWGLQTTQGSVVYVDMELSRKQLYKRLTKLLESRGIALARGQLHLISLRGHVTSAVKTVERIRKAAPDGVALVIIDPIYKFNAGRDENSAGDIGEMLNILESLAVEIGAAVAYAAHYSKGNQAAKESIDRISGSGVYARDADSLVMMTKHEEDGAFSIEPTLRNFAPISPFAMRWNYPLMERADDLDPAKLKKAPGTFEAKYSVTQLVETLGADSLTFRQVVAKAKEHCGMSKATTERLMRQGIEAGSIEKLNLFYRAASRASRS